jgi:hypothetical protein
MASMKGRILQSWNKTGPRPYMKCVAIALFDQGLRGNAHYAAFAAKFPRWKDNFDRDISDTAPLGRAYMARHSKTDAPEKHPKLKPLWERAVADAKTGKVWSNKELRLAFPPDKKPASKPPAKKRKAA